MDQSDPLSASYEEAQSIASKDTEFISHLYVAFPEAAHHAGYDIFDPAWVKKYGRQILRAIGRIKDVESWDNMESLAAGVAAGAIASELLTYLNLPQSHYTSALALIIIIYKGMKPDQA